MAENEPNSPPKLNSTYPNSSLRSSLLLSPPPTNSPPTPYSYRQNATPLRPSIAVIVAVLTTMFSITFLLLLYAKHCKRDNGRNFNVNTHGLSAARKNSGINRSVIESLPIFRFAALRGHKEGLECSVCLNRFEPNEVLRLLPKCKHAFHVECVDTWLDAHSTCPLCRYRVDPEDVLLVEEIHKEETHRKSVEEAIRLSTEFKSDEFTRRISGRHSSAGERTSSFLQILVQRPGESTQAGVHHHHHNSIRKSVDSAISRKRSETVSVGCFDRGGVRKDGLLLSAADRENFLRRFDHRIILSTQGGDHRKWSDLRPSDLLFLQSEMIIANSGRYSLSSSLQKKFKEEDGKNVIKTRCMSEITGLNRFGGPK
ncbi:RING-type E3 ubiquitin transferase [Ranunculus cassubicifolius]